MHTYWEVILEALIDTVKILPLLFVVYYLIELIEFKYAIKIQNNKKLKGKTSPLYGSLLGCIPQCGFSVVSTDLFSKGAISIGALIAVFIATSDEAIPLMFSNPKYIHWMIALMVVKIFMGIIVGYLSMVLYKIILKKQNDKYQLKTENHKHKEHNEHEHLHEEHHDEVDEELELNVHGGCCHHHVETKTFDWKHPLLHCLKIALFILIINVLFNIITHIWVGEQKMMEFLDASKFVQPVLAVLVGLIPNCASSVVLTELFMSGGLTFSSLVAGLCVNAGLGLVFLIRANKNWKEDLFIVTMLIVPSLIFGYLFLFI